MNKPAATARPAGHACDAECWYASGPAAECVCACRGSQHGVRRQAPQISVGLAARLAADPFLGAAVDDDEEW